MASTTSSAAGPVGGGPGLGRRRAWRAAVGLRGSGKGSITMMNEDERAAQTPFSFLRPSLIPTLPGADVGRIERGIPMTKSSAFAKGAFAAAAGLMALGCAAAAQAQPYDGPGYSNYDPCKRDAGNRGIMGALVGGGIGAVVGSQAAANHHRTDGSLLGGALGALAGAAIGHNTTACKDAPPPPPEVEYRDVPPPPPPPVIGYRDVPPPPPPPPSYVQREVWVYGRHGVRYRVIDDRYDRYGCTLADSPVYMPDGRVDHRAVRVCPDDRGRYYVVD
jgi:hypothetical protein